GARRRRPRRPPRAQTERGDRPRAPRAQALRRGGRMNLDLRYLGASEVQASGAGATVRFSPNLARSRVFFDAELVHPLRFREAVSALHDVVVGDLRFKKKDKTAYREWKQEQDRKDAEMRRVLQDKAKRAELARLAKEPIPPNLEADFRRMHQLYWNARVRWAHELSRDD